jgi:hypothetical protein
MPEYPEAKGESIYGEQSKDGLPLSDVRLTKHTLKGNVINTAMLPVAPKD